MKAKLGLHLDPSHWHGCGDGESILVDTLVYTNMLIITNFRMMASLRLSLDYVIDLSQVKNQLRVFGHLNQVLGGIGRHLFNFGFTEVTKLRQDVSPDSLTYKLTMDYEVTFISGWQEEKKDDLNCLLLEGFLQRKERRPFFIQCQHQLLRHDPQRKCCEPQMKTSLDQVTKLLCDAHSKLTGVLSIPSVHMMLEEDPCWACESQCIPLVAAQMERHRIPLQLVSMLPYSQYSVFLERLTEEGGPVQLKADLRPFEERHACIVQKHCRHVRYHKHCHYSNPSKVLAMDDSLAASPYSYFVLSRGGGRKVRSSRMCKFHTSQSTRYRAFIKNVDHEQRRRIILSNERKRQPEGGKRRRVGFPRRPRAPQPAANVFINTTVALSLLRSISACVSIIAAVI